MQTTTDTAHSNGHTLGVYQGEEVLPPHNQDAEASVLGSVLIDPSRFSELSLEPVMFFRSLHRQIYVAFQELQAKKRPIDFITLNDILYGKGIEEEAKLIGLLTVVPTSVNIHSYADIVKEMYNRRRLISLAGRLANKAFDFEESLDSTVADTMEGVRVVGGEASDGEPVSSYDACETLLGTLTGRHETKTNNEVSFLATGFLDLDRLLEGIERGSLVVCAGRPGMGKSVLEQNVRISVAASGKQVATFNLEMSTEQLMIRAVASRLKIPYKAVSNPWGMSEQHWLNVHKAIGELSELPMYIDDMPSLSIAQLEAKAHRLVASHGHFDLITVDYLQLMTGNKSAKNRVQEVGQISKGLKQLARELDTVIWANAQINRAVEARVIKKPTLADLRESGSIEQDADIVMFIYRDEVYNPETLRANIAEIDVAKHRNGDLGQVDLYFNGAKMLFRNLTRETVSF